MKEPVWVLEKGFRVRQFAGFAAVGGRVRRRNRSQPPVYGRNKRAGFMTAYVFLGRNGSQLVASEAEATQAVLGLAAGKIDEAAFTRWLRANVRARRGR